MSAREVDADHGLNAARALATAAKATQHQVDAHRRAWAREMERAQIAAWLPDDPLKRGLPPLARPPISTADPRAGDGSTFSRFEGSSSAPDDAGAAAPSRTSRLAATLQQFGDVSASSSGFASPAVDDAHGSGTAPATEGAGAAAGSSGLGTAMAGGGAAGRVIASVASPSDRVAPFAPSPAQRTFGAQFAVASSASLGSETPTSIFAMLSADVDVPVGDNYPPARQDIAAPSRLDMPAPGRTSCAATPPIRLHAEWSAEGVSLWLALDANVLDRMQVIAQVVRQWVKGQGVKLISLSCNGRPLPIDESATPEPTNVDHATRRLPKEKAPWPSAQ